MRRWLFVYLCLAWPLSAWATTTMLISGDNISGPSNSATNYTTVISNEEGALTTWNGTEANRESVVSPAGTLKDLQVSLKVAPGGSASWTFTLYKNAAPSAITCQVSAAATTCTDLVNSVAVVAGDTLSFESVPSSTPAATEVKWSLHFASTTASETPIMTLDTAATASTFSALMGINNAETTANDVKSLLATAGTMKNLYVVAQTAPGVGKSRTVTVRKNGVGTAITCTMSDPATTCNDTTHTVSYVAGDALVFADSGAGGPATTVLSEALTFAATTDGQFVTNSVNDAGMSAGGTGATTYMPINAADFNPGMAASDAGQLAQAGTLDVMYVEIVTAPGAGQSQTFTLYDNGATALTCQIADANTTCNATITATLSTADLISIQDVPSSASAADPTKIRVGLAGTATTTTTRRRTVWWESE